MGFDQDAKEIELIQNVEDLVVKGKSNRKYLQRLALLSFLPAKELGIPARPFKRGLSGQVTQRKYQALPPPCPLPLTELQ